MNFVFTLKDLKKSKDFIFLWIITTSIFCISVVIFQELARQVTLDNVRAYDFKIIRNAIKGEANNIEEKFLLASNELTSKELKSVLFPLAIINKKTCQGNGSSDSNNKLCTFFPNLNEWESSTQNEQFNSYYKISYKAYNQNTFMFSKINDQWILVGEAGNYLRLFGNEQGQFFEFLFNQLPKKISSTSAIYGMYYKSKWTLGLISLLSMLALSITVYKIRRSEFNNLEKFNIAKNAVKDIEVKCAELQNKIDIIKDQLINKDNLINSLESQFTLSQSNIQEQNQQIEEWFEKSLNYENEVKLLEKHRIELENEREMLLEKVVNTSTLVSIEVLQTELKKSQQEYNNISRLWRSNTKWQDRHLIEERVGIQHRVPFTLSAAFIAFESWADDYYNELSSSKLSEDNLSLKEKIDIIASREPQRRSVLHKIRIARNAWFHSGKSPEKGLIKELLTIVANEEPRI